MMTLVKEVELTISRATKVTGENTFSITCKKYMMEKVFCTLDSFNIQMDNKEYNVSRTGVETWNVTCIGLFSKKVVFETVFIEYIHDDFKSKQEYLDFYKSEEKVLNFPEEKFYEDMALDANIDYVEDADKNIVSYGGKTGRSKADALKQLSTLRSCNLCYNCTNCYECSYCYECDYCQLSDSLENCDNVLYSDNSVNCVKCFMIKHSSFLIDCIGVNKMHNDTDLYLINTRDIKYFDEHSLKMCIKEFTRKNKVEIKYELN